LITEKNQSQIILTEMQKTKLLFQTEEKVQSAKEHNWPLSACPFFFQFYRYELM